MKGKIHFYRHDGLGVILSDEKRNQRRMLAFHKSAIEASLGEIENIDEGLPVEFEVGSIEDTDFATRIRLLPREGTKQFQ